LEPSVLPSLMPSLRPTLMPTLTPSLMPSAMPSSEPSLMPSLMPSAMPSQSPTFHKCFMSLKERRIRMIEILETVSDPVTLHMPNTPQNLALEWIIEQDTYCVCPQDFKFVQRYVLAVFYFSTGGGTWNECNAPSNYSDPTEIAHANTNCSILGDGHDVLNAVTFQGTDAWLTPSYECNWGGLACRNSTLCLDRIEFETDGLSGTLPFELQNLTELHYLIVEEGTTSGTIPSAFGTFPELIILDLNFNNLTGSIPEDIYNLPLLFQLDLNDNFLSGTISSAIGNLENLQFLQLEVNKFTGTIPETLGNIPNLIVLEVFGNELNGTMPDGICQNRNTQSGFIGRLTADCDPDDVPRVDCPVPECCTACPF